MKKVLLLGSLLLAAPAARAGGVNVAWGDLCWSEPGANVSLMTFACDSNTSPPSWSITCSFATDVEIPDFYGVVVRLRGQAETETVPDWWLQDLTQCRNGYATASANWSALGTGVCQDRFDGNAAVITPPSWEAVTGFANAFEMRSGATLSAPIDLLPNVETYAMTFRIMNGHTSGAGACAGCADGVVLGLYTVVAAGLTSQVTLAEPLPNGNQCLIWQHAFTGQPCHYPVPARTATWGQIKSMYR